MKNNKDKNLSTFKTKVQSGKFIFTIELLEREELRSNLSYYHDLLNNVEMFDLDNNYVCNIKTLIMKSFSNQNKEIYDDVFSKVKEVENEKVHIYGYLYNLEINTRSLKTKVIIKK